MVKIVISYAKSMILACCCFGLIAVQAHGQTKTSHSLGLGGDFFQVHDEWNGGVLFSGVGGNIDFRAEHFSDEKISLWESKIGGNILNGKEIFGVAAEILPLQYSYLTHVADVPLMKDIPACKIYIGGSIGLRYNVQVYPDLQMGQLFWNSTLSLAPAVILQQQLGSNILTVRSHINLLGLVSTTPSRREGYFYSLQPMDIIEQLHSNIRVFSIADVVSSYAAIGVAFPLSDNPEPNRLSIDYEMEYRSLSIELPHSTLQHGVVVRLLF